MKVSAGVFVLVAIVAFSSSAAAVVLYERPFDRDLQGIFSNLGNQEGADEFAPSQTGVITGVKWYGYYQSIDLDPAVTSVDFSVAFLADASAGLGAELARYTLSADVSDTGQVMNDAISLGKKIYEFQADLPSSLPATAGQTLWLSLAEADAATSDIGGTQWKWNRWTDLTTEKLATRTPPGGWNVNNLGSLSFTILGDVPVIPAPAALLLGSLGVGLVGWMRRNKTL